MKNLNFRFAAGVALLLLATAAQAASYPAGAITYTASRAVDDGHVDLKIVTNGRIGVIGESSVLDWDILVSDSIGSHRFLGPVSGFTSFLQITSEGLRATPTELLFDFSWNPGPQPGGFTPASVLFQYPSIGQGGPFYLLAASPLYRFESGEALSPDFVRFGRMQLVERKGEQVIATVASPVPEPRIWLMLIAGFGAVGLTLRRARRVTRDSRAIPAVAYWNSQFPSIRSPGKVK